MFDAYSGSTGTSTSFKMCLYPGFTMVGRMGFLSFLPPIVAFFIMFWVGRHMGPFVQSMVRWVRSKQKDVEKSLAEFEIKARNTVKARSTGSMSEGPDGSSISSSSISSSSSLSYSKRSNNSSVLEVCTLQTVVCIVCIL
jgi:hypothetical protein